MSYLVYIALFGAAVVFFLWLRDARIFYRTGLSGFQADKRENCLGKCHAGNEISGYPFRLHKGKCRKCAEKGGFGAKNAFIGRALVLG